MAKIQNETAYKAAMERIEELLPLTDEQNPLTDKHLIELDLLSELVSEYEDEQLPDGALRAYFKNRPRHQQETLYRCEHCPWGVNHFPKAIVTLASPV